MAGPLLGALVLESLQQYFTLQSGASQAYLIIYGGAVPGVVLLLPRGVIPSVEELLGAVARAARRGPGAGGRGGRPAADVAKAAGVR